jgi:imidazolonepropionase-like amidohydrolase
MRKLLTYFGRGGILASLWLLQFVVLSLSAADLLPPGYRPLPLGSHALIGGKLITKPGEALDEGVIIIRDGRIQQVGKGIAPPEDARIWDLRGATIYAGFIDPYVVLGSNSAPAFAGESEPVTSSTLTAGGINFYGAPGQKSEKGNAGPGYEIAKITPDYRAVREYSPKEKAIQSLRELGFTAGVVAPAKGIIRGTSALVAFSDENPNQVVLKPDVFQHIVFETHQTDERAYPGSLMGVIASIRQSAYDAQHYAVLHDDYSQHPERSKRPEFDPALEALAPVIGKKMRVLFEPGSALMIGRAASLARDLGLDFCLVSCGQEWRRPDLAKAAGGTFIVPLNFPILPKLPNDSDWEQINLDQLRAWDWAAENPALLRGQGLEIALTTHGLADKKKFRSNLQLAIQRGLSETDALAALTTIPAKLCGLEKELGTIEPGKLANLTVVQGGTYFNPEAKLREIWIDGRIYRPPSEETKPAKPEEPKPAQPSSPEEGDPNKAKAEPPKTPAPDVSKAGTNTSVLKEEKPAEPKKDKNKEPLRELQKSRLAHSPLDGRGPIAGPLSIVITNATVWTCGEQGVLTNCSIKILAGKIEKIGSFEVEQGPNLLVIDGQGLHVTPGLIDCHSHTAILGSVNESTLPSTAMVRIRDVINSETDNLGYQLAGGVTAVNLLHGSANPIGGQNCVIKLRDGAVPDELIFQPAPQGIKFALGENVKQSNWGDRNTTRFPQTRMGVRTFIANRFTAAKAYLKEWEAFNKMGTNNPPTSPPGAPQEKAGAKGASVAPRRDLELEALGEIIQGQRLIHCHSYRQDEILMLIRLMESFGVKIATFQHVLEGYKVADEIAKHGAGGSTFSDWWAYKFEVYDAIPYNAALMHDRGVIVSINSDSSEVARHLYLEAAKSVRFGGTPEIEALKFVTLNPAKQLRIDKYVGSLEPGKDADFVLWSKSPLDSSTVCLQTWIEGKKYFDRSLVADRASKLEKERTDLIAKARKVSKLSSGGGETPSETDKSFFHTSLEHEFDGTDRHCLDELEEAQ